MAKGYSLRFLWIFITIILCCEFCVRAKDCGLKSIISKKLFDQIFLHRNDNACPANGFYTYKSFITAARSYPQFANTGNLTTCKREVAAFLAQISHETTGGWATAPDGPYSWGLCFKEEIAPQNNYCDITNKEWPCVANKSYHGRGPIQLSWNYNYGPAGKAIGFNGLKRPEMVSKKPVIAFKTALWFWTTTQPPKPSCHDVIIGKYTPTSSDAEANRLPGFGLITNIINGGLECGKGKDARVADRIGFYKRYCTLLNVDPGQNLDCGDQKSFT
ncbi:hypothetical protein SUGI_0645090 [Cryptomeria japonica]|uniref:basic endochitinase-like n=1 Tax=Cryptomeria japonica TaxID=3369 RepID=UPI002414CA00|nr:basic endochitinase-like [Cryptomeria japonica]GLJ32031.1 hypothetical protein SUGI_0645090 [Cryptomeria japonica]